ncbi:protein PELPK2-like [Quercus suber]|uniref:protein PELPK2-like n=1 Tax=Quercus suber TaxID=58331 RepID=UPI0032E01A26
MASTRFLFAAFMLLSSLVVIASANDYGNAPKPDYNTPKPEYKPTPTKPDYNTPKPEGNYNPDLPKIPDYEKPNLPEGKDELLPTIFGIQGLVLCKSGSQYFPLEGAVARITSVAAPHVTQGVPRNTLT